MYQWGNNKPTKVYKVSQELHERLYHSSQQMQLAYERKTNMKKLSQKIQSLHDKLMLEKCQEVEEERGLHEKNQHLNVIYTMICNLLQLKKCAAADNNIEKLCFELEKDKKYSWRTPFNGIFFINRCPTLSGVEHTTNKLEMKNATQPSFLKPIEEVLQSSLVNSSQELTLEASAELVHECSKEVLMKL